MILFLYVHTVCFTYLFPCTRLFVTFFSSRVHLSFDFDFFTQYLCPNLVKDISPKFWALVIATMPVLLIGMNGVDCPDVKRAPHNSPSSGALFGCLIDGQNLKLRELARVVGVPNSSRRPRTKQIKCHGDDSSCRAYLCMRCTWFLCMYEGKEKCRILWKIDAWEYRGEDDMVSWSGRLQLRHNMVSFNQMWAAPFQVHLHPW